LDPIFNQRWLFFLKTGHGTQVFWMCLIKAYIFMTIFNQ
jgi:hypothetical protein